MPASQTTISLKDGLGASKNLNVIDMSGTGAGPFVSIHALSDKNGTPIDSTNALPVSGSLNIIGGNATAVKVDGSSVTQPVSGTVSVVGGNTTAVKTDGSSVTQPISGSVTVIGGNTTAVKIDGSSVTQPVSGTVSVSGEVEIKNDSGNPITNSEQPVQGIIDMPLAGTPYQAGRGVEIDAKTAGTVTLTYLDGSTRTRTFGVGLTRLPDSVTQWDKPSSPASAFVGTVCNLK